MSESSAKTIRYPLKRLLTQYFARIGSAWWLVAVNATLMLIITAAQAMFPRISGWLIDALRTDPEGFSRRYALPGIAILSVVTIMYYAMEFGQKTIGSLICLKIRAGFQRDLYRHLLRLSEDFYQRTKIGEIGTRLTKDMNSGIGPFYQNMYQSIWAFGVLIMASAVLAGIHWLLAVSLLGISALWLTAGRYYYAEMFRRQRELGDQYGALTARMTEGVASQELVRAFSAQQRQQDELNVKIGQYLKRSLALNRLNCAVYAATDAILYYLAPLLVLAFSAGAPGQQFTAGDIVAVYGTWTYAAMPLTAAIFIIPALASSRASLDRVLEFFDETPLVKDIPDAPELKVSTAHVEFDTVSFAYPLRPERPVLKSLTLDIRAGSRTAIVGPTGSGKSTIVSLLMRLYDPQEGCVRIDGQDVRTVAQRSVRERIGLVMQETILMSGSIADNLKFVRPQATPGEMEQALRHAGLWDFVASTERGLDTLIGERGVGLSGGQRQRLGIARVFLMDPPIVIFDEATSALDSLTERDIQSAMAELFSGRTSIIIAHRISTVIDCESIVVLHDGEVVGQGEHASLVRTCELYRRLCEEQRVSKG